MRRPRRCDGVGRALCLASALWLVALAKAPRGAASPAPAPGRTVSIRAARTISAARLAETYYGTPRASRAVLLANGISAWGRRLPRIQKGKRLSLPTAWGYRIRRGDRWPALGRRYLGDASRGAFLARLNGKAADRAPPVGHVLLIPALISLRPPPRMGLLQLAARLLGVPLMDARARALAARIQRYNRLRGQLAPRRQIVIPLVEFRLLAWYLPNLPPDTAARPDRRAREALRASRVRLLKGDFLGALAATAAPVGWDRVDRALQVERWLVRCTAWVALSRLGLARTAARAALALNPHLVLDAATVSPKVRAVFGRVRRARRAR